MAMTNRIAVGSMQPEINRGMIRLNRALDALGAAVEKKAPTEAGAEGMRIRKSTQEG